MSTLTGTSFIVPTSSEAFYRIRTDLDNIEYVLDFAFNQRELCWYMDISDTNENVLRRGIKLVVGSPLGNAAWNPAMPPGLLIVLTNTTDDTPPAQFDLIEDTGRCILVYFSVTQ